METTIASVRVLGVHHVAKNISLGVPQCHVFDRPSCTLEQCQQSLHIALLQYKIYYTGGHGKTSEKQYISNIPRK